MTIWVYVRLKRPFTLADLLFYPDDKVIKSKSHIVIDDLQAVSVLKWIPMMNLIICSLYVLARLIFYFLASMEWLYKNELKRIFDKIVFK